MHGIVRHNCKLHVSSPQSDPVPSYANWEGDEICSSLEGTFVDDRWQIVGPDVLVLGFCRHVGRLEGETSRGHLVGDSMGFSFDRIAFFRQTHAGIGVSKTLIPNAV